MTTLQQLVELAVREEVKKVVNRGIQLIAEEVVEEISRDIALRTRIRELAQAALKDFLSHLEEEIVPKKKLKRYYVTGNWHIMAEDENRAIELVEKAVENGDFESELESCDADLSDDQDDEDETR
jgi:hypothetical protein